MHKTVLNLNQKNQKYQLNLKKVNMESKNLVKEGEETQYTDEAQAAEAFHKIEIKCIGYDNYVDCSDENYIATLEELR
jgi:hypothetical protein